MIPIIVCICVATILHSLHKCTIWKSWLTYYGALLRHPFRGTCCGLYSWEIATSSRTVRFTMNHRHFWAAPRQWLSKAKGIESDYSCSIRQLGSEIPVSLAETLRTALFFTTHPFLPATPATLTGIRFVSSLWSALSPVVIVSSSQSLAFIVPTWCPVFCT